MKSEAKPSQTSIRLGKNSSEANRKSDATRIVYSDSKNAYCDTDNHSQYGLSNVKKDKSRQNITNNSGEILWHNKELKSVDKSSFLNISNLPLFYAEYTPILGKSRGLIINSNTGAILFDTKDDNYRIKGYTLLPENGMILF